MPEVPELMGIDDKSYSSLFKEIRQSTLRGIWEMTQTIIMEKYFDGLVYSAEVIISSVE